jgi:4-amino-4-deoxy-L-arabinose transferase-like glycosyltransferase
VKRAVALLVAAVIVSLYGLGLACSPVYLHFDEVFFALNAHAIASGGHDVAGHFLPLYFQVLPGVWFHPVLVYAMAGFLKLLPLREWVIRLPLVVAGLIDVVLMYMIAARVFGRQRPAIVAATLLALAPAHFIHSRLGMDYLLPVPFVLTWLFCLAIFLERRQPWVLVAGTGVLGIGIYSYIASIVLMPMCLVLTFLALVQHRVRPTRLYLAAACGFTVALVPLIVWCHSHPAVYAEQVRRYKVYDPAALAPLQGLRTLFSHAALSDRISVYYNYFNPSFLFFSGDASLIASTREAGVFLWPTAVFLATGLYQMARNWRSGINAVVLAGFVTAPLAATIAGEPYRISRAMTMVPFGALIAAAGAESMLQARSGGWPGARRLLAALLLAFVPIQFGRFYVDYLTEYRSRSSVWFEGAAGEAFDDVLKREAVHHAPAFYLSRRFRWVAEYWKLYLIKHGREDLLRQTVYFEPGGADPRALVPGTLIVQPYDISSAAHGREDNSAAFRTVKVIAGPDGRPTFEILEKV